MGEKSSRGSCLRAPPDLWPPSRSIAASGPGWSIPDIRLSSPNPSEPPPPPPTPPPVVPPVPFGCSMEACSSHRPWFGPCSGSPDDTEEEDDKEETDSRQAAGEDSWQFSCSIARWGLPCAGGLWVTSREQELEGGDVDVEEEDEEKPVLPVWPGERLARNPLTQATMDICEEEQMMAVILIFLEEAAVLDGGPVAVTSLAALAAREARDRQRLFRLLAPSSRAD